MSTKDFSSVDTNSKTLAISNPNQDDVRYRNLNLNAIQQHSETNHTFSKNVSFNKGKAFTNFTDHLTPQSQTKNDVNLWHKRDESFKTSEFLTFHDCDEKTNQKRWQKSDGSSANSSTLSLHIAAYENAIEAAETESSKKVQKHFYDSFEIPRQQEDSPVEPEVMQYKSSQKVLNPNETSSAKSGVNKKASKKSSEEMAKGTNKLTLRRAKSPTYLEVQTNVSETGFKTIKSDKGSDRNESRIIQSPQILAQSPKSPLQTAMSPPPLTAISPPPLTAKRAQTARTIVVMRHGERLDDLFGEWYSYCKNKNGKYRQRDLNMPPDLSPLNRPLGEYQNDTALTVLGHVLAQMVGRAMLVSGRSPDMVYCSPALRCIQTASVAATMTGRPFKLRIEPGLFENFDLYPDKKPKFVTVEELKHSGFNLDDDYTPYCKMEDLFAVPESNEMYNDRVQSSLQYIANKSAPGRGTVLVAAHASTVDLAFGKFHSRFLKEPRQTTPENLMNISIPVPYSSNVTFMRNSDDDQWQYIREALPPITYRNFSNRLNHDFIERCNAAQQ